MEVGAKEVRKFPWSLKGKGSLDSSCIPLDTAVWAKSRSWIGASLGERKNLSSTRSLWEQGWPEEDLEAWAASLTCLCLASLEKERPLQPSVERKALDSSADSLI